MSRSGLRHHPHQALASGCHTQCSSFFITFSVNWHACACCDLPFSSNTSLFSPVIHPNLSSPWNTSAAMLRRPLSPPRLLGSTSLLGEAVGSRGASSHARLFWAGTRGESRCAEGARVGACEAADRFVNSASPHAAAPRTFTYVL